MKNKMRILAMICAGLLVVGCDNNSTSDKTEEQAAAKAETTQSALPASDERASGASTSGGNTQALVDPAQGAPAELSTSTSELNAGAGATMTVPVMVKNTSQVSFMAAKDLSSSDNEIDFVVDYLDSTGKPIDSLRAIVPLPDTLAAGQSGTYQLPVTAPATAGQYTLQINLVQQGKTYFSDAGVKSVSIPVSVK